LDQLPGEVTGPLRDGLVRELNAGELARAFGVVAAALVREAGHVDADLAARLAPALREMTGP
jgi:hypothetical protein